MCNRSRIIDKPFFRGFNVIFIEAFPVLVDISICFQISYNMYICIINVDNVLQTIYKK